MAKKVIVDTNDGQGPKEMYQIGSRGSCTVEVSDTPTPSDRHGSTRVVFDSHVKDI